MQASLIERTIARFAAISQLLWVCGRDSRFLTGNTGGPGRPKGSRNKLSEEFLVALHADWVKHGPSVIDSVRQSNPVAYLRVIATVVPRTPDIETGGKFDHMTHEEVEQHPWFQHARANPDSLTAT